MKPKETRKFIDEFASKNILITIKDHNTGVEYKLYRNGKIKSSTNSDVTIDASNFAYILEQYKEELKILGYEGPDPISEPDEYIRMWGVRKGII